MPLSENNIETYLRDQVKKKGGLALKFVCPGFTGVMDRLVLLYPGIVLFIETKAPGKNLRKRQEFVRKQFEALGMKVYKVDSKEQVNSILNEIQ